MTSSLSTVSSSAPGKAMRVPVPFGKQVGPALLVPCSVDPPVQVSCELLGVAVGPVGRDPGVGLAGHCWACTGAALVLAKSSMVT